MVTVPVFGGYVFRPRLGMTLAAVAGIVLTLMLGQWQVGRAQYKDMLQLRQDERGRLPPVGIGAQLAAREDVLQRRVEVRGEFVPGHTVYVDNRVYRHQPGYHVATPLRITGSQRHVLVNRGWIAAGRDRSPPAVPTPSGEQAVQGVAVAYGERYIELSAQVVEGRIWQNLNFDRFRESTGLELQPFVIQQHGAVEDGLVREWSRPDSGRNTHLAYAFQWRALSLAIFIVYLVTHVRRRPEEP